MLVVIESLIDIIKELEYEAEFEPDKDIEVPVEIYEVEAPPTNSDS